MKNKEANRLCSSILEELAYIKLMVQNEDTQKKDQIEHFIDSISINTNKLRDLKDMSNNISIEIVELRKFLSKHSYKYYIDFSEEISDTEWDKKAYELVLLQEKYGVSHGWEDDLFSDWNGDTGMHIAMKGKGL